MARSVTLANLILWIRTEAGLTGSTAVTDTEIIALVNVAWPELYDMLVGAYGHDYYAKSGTFSTVAGQRAYALPTVGGVGTDIYKLLGVSLTVSGETFPIDPVDFNHRDIGSGSSCWQSRLTRPGYRYHGSELWLVPPPDAVYTVTVHWLPCATTVTAAQSIDGVNGWDRYIVAWVVARLMAAEETDPSVYLAELASLTRRIESMAAGRVADGPDQIVRRRKRRFAVGYGDE
jgi:hypothetical protein